MQAKCLLMRLLITTATTIIMGALFYNLHSFSDLHNWDITNLTSANETRSIESNSLCSSGNQTISSSERKKRFLIFSGNGVVKFVFGISFPIKLADRQRSLSMFYNFHVQYMPPTRPIYWWSLFNSSTFAARSFRSHSHPPLQHITGTSTQDTGRLHIYKVIESFLRRNGKNNKDCLLQAICLTVRQPFDENGNNNIFGALINSLLIPVLPNVSHRYLDAVKIGRSNINCTKAFNNCPENQNWLKATSYFV